MCFFLQIFLQRTFDEVRTQETSVIQTYIRKYINLHVVLYMLQILFCVFDIITISLVQFHIITVAFQRKVSMKFDM